MVDCKINPNAVLTKKISFHHKGIPAGLQSGVITSTVFVHYRNYGKLNSTQ